MPGPVSTGMGHRIGVQLPLREICLSLTNHPSQLSLAIPSWVGTMSTGQRAVMLCDWGVKAADMVLFAGNTVWSISERVRGVCVDTLYKSTFTLLCFASFICGHVHSMVSSNHLLLVYLMIFFTYIALNGVTLRTSDFLHNTLHHHNATNVLYVI